MLPKKNLTLDLNPPVVLVEVDLKQGPDPLPVLHLQGHKVLKRVLALEQQMFLGNNIEYLFDFILSHMTPS